MIRKSLFVLSVFSLGLAQAQVGINNTDPKSTLHVSPTTTGGTTAEGIIAPNLTRGQLISKDSQYGADQRGAIVYVTAIDGTVTTKTVNVLTSSYYYFDGSVWQPFSSGTGGGISSEPWLVQGSGIQATSNNENIYQSGSVAVGINSAGIYKFQVAGTSNISGNSRVGSSTVLGNETVGGTLGVTGTSTLTGNVGIGTSPSAVSNLKLNVAGNEYLSGIAKFGGGSTYNTSAQLELSDNDKGLLPNRVALISSTIKSPVTNAVDGIIVYNTATVTSQGLSPGYYYWRDNSWRRFIDELPEPGKIRRYYQTASVKAGIATGSNQSGMTSIPFSETGVTHSPKTIRLPNDGSYAFNVKLYSQIHDLGTGQAIYPKYSGKVIIYLGIWVNNVLHDVSEVFSISSVPASGSNSINGSNVTNVILGCEGKVGDVVDIRIGYFADSLPATEGVLSRGVTNTTPRSDRTSLIFWKL